MKREEYEKIVLDRFYKAADEFAARSLISDRDLRKLIAAQKKSVVQLLRRTYEKVASVSLFGNRVSMRTILRPLVKIHKRISR